MYSDNISRIFLITSEYDDNFVFVMILMQLIIAEAVKVFVIDYFSLYTVQFEYFRTG